LSWLRPKYRVRPYDLTQSKLQISTDVESTIRQVFDEYNADE